MNPVAQKVFHPFIFRKNNGQDRLILNTIISVSNDPNKIIDSWVKKKKEGFKKAEKNSVRYRS